MVILWRIPPAMYPCDVLAEEWEQLTKPMHVGACKQFLLHLRRKKPHLFEGVLTVAGYLQPKFYIIEVDTSVIVWQSYATR